MLLLRSSNRFLLVVLLVDVIVVIHAQPYPCDVKPADNCDCWMEMDGTMDISCNRAGLTAVPNLKSNSPHARIGKLELSHNNITSIGPEDFAGTEVRFLVLSHNQIRDIHPQAFRDMTFTLSKLDLSDNHLSSIPEFLADSVLSSIDLHDNRIPDLLDVFSKLPPRVKAVGMQGNEIEPFQVNEDHGEFLSLPIETLSFGPVAGVFKFENLVVLKNRLLKKLTIVGSGIEIKEHSMKDIKKLERLEDLTLDRCQLTSGSDLRDLFVTLGSQLKSLSLPNNGLARVPSLLNHLSNLHILNLANNNIRKIYYSDFESLQKLEFLHLENNRINYVHVDSFAHLSNIRRLDLSGNELKTLPKDAFNVERLNYIKVYLGNNPWRCTCDVFWIVEAIRKEMGGSIGPLDPGEFAHDGLQCASPDSLRGVPVSAIASMQEYYDECSVYPGLI